MISYRRLGQSAVVVHVSHGILFIADNDSDSSFKLLCGRMTQGISRREIGDDSRTIQSSMR